MKIIVWSSRVLAFVFALLASTQAWAQTEGWIDRAGSGSIETSLGSIEAAGWVYDKMYPYTPAVLRLFNLRTGETEATHFASPTGIRDDVNRHLGLSKDARTGWRVTMDCEFGSMYYVWSENIQGQKYVICRNDDPVLKVQVVDQAGKPVGLNATSEWLSVKLVKLEEEWSYQPFDIQEFSKGNGMILDGDMRSWKAMEPGWYTITVDGYRSSTAYKTFYYPGGTLDLGKMVIHRDTVELSVITESTLAGDVLDYKVQVQNWSGRDIEVYTIVRMPGTHSDIPFENGQRVVLTPGSHTIEQKAIKVPSWAPNGLYVVLDVIAVEREQQHTLLGRTIHSVYIRR